MKVTLKNVFSALFALLREPVDLIRAMPHQFLISLASVSFMAFFIQEAKVLDPNIGYALAVGIEWAFFRSLVEAERARSDWGAVLNLSALVTISLWGMLGVGISQELLDAQSGGWSLVAAHILPVSWLSFCAAQTHRAYVASVTAEQREAAEREQRRRTLDEQRELRTAEDERLHQRRLAEQREAAELEARQRREAAELEAQVAYRQMKIDEERRAIRLQTRAVGSVAKTNTATRRLSGSAPSGSAPSGSAPSGSAPSGSAPSGSAPSGSAPSGSAPSDVVCPHCAAPLKSSKALGAAKTNGYCLSCKPTK